MENGPRCPHWFHYYLRMCVCEHICVFSLRIMSSAVLSLLQSSRPYVRLCSDSLNLQLNGFVHLAIGFFFFFRFFFYQQGGVRGHNKCKKNLTSRKHTRTVTNKHTHKHSCTLRLRLVRKETDLPGLTRVQMSQCGWISFGIVSAPSFDKEVCLSPRWDMTVSSGLRSPRQHSGFVREDTGEPT